jgi:hypothetical protein
LPVNIFNAGGNWKLLKTCEKTDCSQTATNAITLGGTLRYREYRMGSSGPDVPGEDAVNGWKKGFQLQFWETSFKASHF